MLKINRFYTILLSFLALASLAATIWVVTSLDPDAGFGSLAALYSSVGLFTLLISALAFYLFKQKFGVREQVRAHFYTSLRQGLWLGLVVVIGLYLQAQDLFTWLHSAFLVAAFAFLESYFLHNDRKKGAENQEN